MGGGLVAPDCSLAPEDGCDTSHGFDDCAAVLNQDQSLCPLYTARVIRSVKVAPSPTWLVQRLESVGLRSVNNVVDVTNFVLLELGQPLHAFDLGKLSGQRIVVRQASKGESIVVIDGSRHQLDPEILVIADAEKPVALAGVMGGLDSRVSETTTDVLLESALFDPMSVRRASRALKMVSDSSHRFERGVDPLSVDIASRRAAKLIGQIAGGTVAHGVVRLGAVPQSRPKVVMRTQRCSQLLGVELTTDQMLGPLDRLGFGPNLDQKSGRITCMVPSYRLDVQREVDLIEEVARLHGFDAIPVNRKIHIVARPVQPIVAARQQLGRVLTAHGYHEAITFSFLGPRFGQPFVPENHQPVVIQDTQGGAESMLRPSILPSLLACGKSNQDVGNTAVRLFECAATWTRRQGKIIERNHVAILRDAEDAQHGLRSVRGTIAELVGHLTGRMDLDYAPADLTNFSGAALIGLEGHELGAMGLVTSPCQRLFDLQLPVVAAQLDLDVLLGRYPPVPAVKPLPKFPAIGRDLSVIVDEPVRWDQIREQVLAVGPDLLDALQFIGVYRGKPIPSEKKSVSFRLLFRDPAATLRHEQVDPQIAAVVKRLEVHLGVRLRG